MNITELRCSSCNGTLKVNPQNPNVVECEYCHTKFMVEWNHPGSQSGQNVQLRQMPQRINYQPTKPAEPKKTGWEPYGWKRGVALVILFFVIMGVWKGPALYRRYKLNQQIASEKAQENSENSQNDGLTSADNTSKKTALTGLLALFAEQVFDQPAEEISESDLAKIQWLEMQNNIDFRRIGYSFNDPLENPDAELTWVDFPRDDYPDADLTCLPAFTGVKRISTSQTLCPEYIEGLSLTGISGYYDSLEQVASLVDDPSQLRYLSVTADPLSLSGLDKLTNLETLILNGAHLEEEKNLVNAKSLKHLTLDMYDGSMDFSTFGMMPWLESLSIESKNIRDLSFISKMKNLASLHLKYGAFLSSF